MQLFIVDVPFVLSPPLARFDFRLVAVVWGLRVFLSVNLFVNAYFSLVVFPLVALLKETFIL